MKLDDEFSLVKHFDRACSLLASGIEAGYSNDLNAYQLSLTIPDIDDWWAITIDGKNILQRYIDHVALFSDNEKKHYFETSYKYLSEFEDYKAHFDAKMSQTAEEKWGDKLRYLPHIIRYMDDVFEKLDGYKKLQDTLKEKGMKGSVFLSPANDVAEEDRNLNGFGVYRLIIVTNEIEPNPSHQTPNPRVS